MDAADIGRAIEFTLPWKFLSSGKGQAGSPYDIMARFSHRLMALLGDWNQIVIPTVNLNDWDRPPSRIAPRRISWHSHGNQPDSLHLKIGTYPHHVSIDRSGYSGWAEFAQAVDFSTESSDIARARFQALSDRLLKDRLSKYAQPSGQDRDVGSDYIFFPMQIPRDRVAKLAAIDTLSLLQCLAGIAERTGKTVVVKRHPRCTSAKVTKLVRRLAMTPGLVFSHGNVHDLIAASRVVVTVNSGVGAEALLHRKPVITTGASDYRFATRFVSDPDELENVLLSDFAGPGSPLLEQFISAYTSNYMVEIDDDAALQKHPALGQFLGGTTT